MLRKFRMKSIILFSSLLFVCLMLFSTNSFAAAFFPTTVQELIDDITTANSNGEFDSINLVPGMVYSITGAETGVPFNDGSGNSGLPTIVSDSSTSITLNGNGATIQRDPSLFTDGPCDGMGLKFKIFNIDGGALTLIGTTVQNGCAVGDSASDRAGGINAINNSSLGIHNSIVTNNESSFSGGGINVDTNSTMSMTFTTVSENFSSGRGGGMRFDTADVDIFNSTISNNEAITSGGAIDPSSSTDISITNCTISGNIAGQNGGAISVDLPTPDIFIVNSTLSENMAGNIGGALRRDASSGTIDLKNSLIVNNFATVAGNNCHGNMGNEGGNITDADDQGCNFAFNADWDTATMLGPLQDNGGGTFTYELIETTAPLNPAIDAILPGNCTDLKPKPGTLDNDQRDFARPFNTNCDVGAFELQETFDLTVELAGTGIGNVSATRIDCGDGNDDCMEIYETGRGVILVPTPAAGSSFVAFTGDPDCEDGELTMDADKSCTATFELDDPPVELTINLTGSGGGNVHAPGINCGNGENDCSESYNNEINVVLMASPDESSIFLGFTGDPDCEDGVVIMDADKSCTARFEPDVPPVELTITLAGTGEGNVHAPGINCGNGETDCSESYFSEINVVLMASPSPGSFFAGFTGDPDCSDGVVTMDSDRNCTATFNTGSGEQVALNVTLAGSGSGIVTSTPAGINCGSDCSELYPEGTQVTMTPTPAPGSVFSGFSGDLDCTNGIVDLIAERNCVATFNEVQTGDLILNMVDPGTAGGTSVISAENATPTGNVAFVWSFNLGTTVIGGPTCNGLEIDLVNPRLLSIISAGGDGVAALNVFVPQFSPMELTILTQAIDIQTCTKSSVVTNILQNQN